MSSTDKKNTYRFGLALDYQVGLRTQALNWERRFEAAQQAGEPLEATIVPVRYSADAGPLSRLPVLPKSMRGTLSGVREIRDGFGDARRFDALLWATWAAKSVPDLVAAAPSMLVMDMTPTQMEDMGRLYGYSKGRARFLGGWKRRATDRIYRQATHLFPWSEWVAQSLRTEYGVPAEKITVLSPGTDISLYRPAEPSEKPGDGVVRLLFVGGDFHRKGGDLLLEWAASRQDRKTFELHIVTRDTDLGTIPGNVFVHRNIGNNSPELVALYRSSDLFVLPTRADCYSLVAMEAMASGLPVIISRLGGIPDIVTEGETGYLIEPDDKETLFTRLDSLVADDALCAQMGTAARQRACERFDHRKNLQVILDRMIAAADAVPSVASRMAVSEVGA